MIIDDGDYGDDKDDDDDNNDGDDDNDDNNDNWAMIMINEQYLFTKDNESFP